MEQQKKSTKDPIKTEKEKKTTQGKAVGKTLVKSVVAKGELPPQGLNPHQTQMWILAHKSRAKYDREIALNLPFSAFVKDLIKVGAIPLKEIVDVIPFYGFKNIILSPQVQSAFEFLISDGRPQTFTFVPVKGPNQFIGKPKIFRAFLQFVVRHCKKNLKLESFGSHVWSMDFIALLVIDFLASAKDEKSSKLSSPAPVPPKNSLKPISKTSINAQAELMSGDLNPLFEPHLEIIKKACHDSPRMEQTVQCLRYLSVQKCGVVHGALIRGILEFTCAEYASKFAGALPKDFNWAPLAKKIQLIANVLMAAPHESENEEKLRHAINSSNVAVNLLNDFVHKDTLPVAKDLVYPLDFAANFVSVAWPEIRK